MMEKLKLKIKQQNIYISILITSILLLLIIWFKDFKLIASGEDGLFLLNPEKSLIIFDNLWVENGTGFSTSDFLPRLPFAYFFNFLNLISIPPFLIQAIVFFILMVTGTLSVFYLINFLNRENKFVNEFSFLSGFLYLFNPYSLTQLWNRQLYSQYFLFALFPLLLYIFIKGLQEKNLKFTFYFSVASLIYSTAFGLITNLIVIWSVIFIYSFYYIIETKNISYLLKYLTITLTVWITCNLWWISPFCLNLLGDSIITNKINSIENLTTLRTLSTYFKFEYLIRLLQSYYFYKDLGLKDFYSDTYLQAFSFLAPILILINLYRIFKSKELRFFLIIFICGLIISLGSNYPFGKLFEYFFIKFAFLQAFRNPYEKYGAVYMLGYVILLSYSLQFLFKNLKNKIILIIFLSTWIYYLSPLIYGERINVTKINKPDFKKQFLNLPYVKDSNERITSLPLTGEGITTNFGYSGVESSLYLYDYPFISYRINSPIQIDFLNNLNEKILTEGNFEPQLSLLNSKHLFLRRDLIEENFFDESKLNEKRLLDVNNSQILKCKKVTYEKNMIENKKVVSCYFEELSFGNSFLLKVISPIINKNLEINIIDTNGNRIIWRNPTQTVNQNNTSTYLVNSILPSEKSKLFDYNKVAFVNIVFDKNVDVNNISLYSFGFSKTPFQVIKAENTFIKVNSISNSLIYEFKDFNQPNHFGYISNIKKLNNLSEIYSLEKISEKLEDTSLVASDQNDNKNLNLNTHSYTDKNIKGQKISIEKYWIENNKSNNNIQNIQLLNTFNSQWTILKNVSKENIQPGFLNTLLLIQKSKSNNLESTHLISNGYANLWQIKNAGDHSGYAVVYLPQIYKDLFIYISGFFYVLIFSIILIFKYLKK